MLGVSRATIGETQMANDVDPAKSSADLIIDGLKDIKDSAAQKNLLRMAEILRSYPGEHAERARSYASSALAISRADKVDQALQEELRTQAEVFLLKLGRGPIAMLRRKLGDNSTYSLLMGVVSAVILAVSLYWIIYYTATKGAVDGNKLRWGDIGLLCMAATMGAVISLLSRIDDFAMLRGQDTFLVYANSLVKPIITCGLAITVYSIFQTQLIKLDPITEILESAEPGAQSIRYVSLIWVFGFVSGFGERFARDLISRTQSMVGAEPKSG